MSGGKGGGQTTQVEIPPFIEQAAKENLRRAQKTAGMGYLPYYGPEVAAFSPLQQQAMRATGGAAEAFGLAGPGFDPLAGMPRADFYDGGLRGYGSGGLLEEALGELQTRSPTQFAAYRNLPTLTPPVAGEPPAPRDGGFFPSPGSGEGVSTFPFGNPLQPGGGNTYPVFSGTDGYPSGFGGMVDFFDPELSSAAGGRGISQQMQQLQEQVDQMRTQPAFDPSGINERIAGLEGRFSGITPFDPSSLQQDIRELRGRESFDPSDLTARLSGLEGRVGGISDFDPSGLQAQILANQERIGGMTQFDPSSINERIAGIEGRVGGMTQFDPSGLQERLAGVESQLGGYQPFDPSELQAQIASLRERPTFDPSGLQGQISGLEQRLGGMNQFDPSGLQAQIAANERRLSGLNQFDPSGLQAQINANQERLAGMGQFDPSGLQSQIAGLEERLGGMNQFDPSGLQQRLSGLESQIGSFQQFDPSGLASQIAALQQQVAGLQSTTPTYGGLRPTPSGFNPVKGGGN